MLQRTLGEPRNPQSLSRELKLRFVMLHRTLRKPRNRQSLSRELKLRFVMLQRTLRKPRNPLSFSRELKLRFVMLQRTLRKPRNPQSFSRELKLRSARRVNPALHVLVILRGPVALPTVNARFGGAKKERFPSADALQHHILVGQTTGPKRIKQSKRKQQNETALTPHKRRFGRQIVIDPTVGPGVYENVGTITVVRN